MLDIKGLLHATVIVKDLKRTRQFYGGVLGLKEVERYNFNFPGIWYAVGDRQLHIVVDESLPETPDPASLDGRHIALEIGDFAGAQRRLEELGVEYRLGRSGLKQIFLRDPDGNLIELQTLG